jgi:hypothetical protein
MGDAVVEMAVADAPAAGLKRSGSEAAFESIQGLKITFKVRTVAYGSSTARWCACRCSWN